MAKDSGTSNNANVYNSIAYGTKIIGKITSDSDFRLDGEIEGDIICNGKLVIGPKGTLKGTVICENAEIIGKLKGSIQVSDTLSIRSTAILEGDVVTKSLIVEPDAVFNGTCSMKSISTEKETNNKN
ncbi:MAG: polymer-forming cytoskeletal protein [Paludibacteraceae bacterium]